MHPLLHPVMEDDASCLYRRLKKGLQVSDWVIRPLVK